MYSFDEIRRENVSSIQMKLDASPHNKSMNTEDRRKIAQPISHSHTVIFPFTSCALAEYMSMWTDFSLTCVFMSIFLLSLSSSFPLSRHQWQRFFKQPQQFFRGTFGRFLLSAASLNDDENDLPTTFEYITGCWISGRQGIGLQRARSDTETTSGVSAPNPSHPDITWFYTSMTKIFKCFQLPPVFSPRKKILVPRYRHILSLGPPPVFLPKTLSEQSLRCEKTS